MTTSTLPYYGSRGGQCCYACDAAPVGLRDRRPEGGQVEIACERHADPTIRIYHACIYCAGPVRRGSIMVDGDFAHKGCHAEACEG